MAEQSSIRFCLVVALAWWLVTYWSLFIRNWPGWQYLRERRAPARRKHRPRLYQKPKPFAGLPRKPVCEQCVAAKVHTA